MKGAKSGPNDAFARALKEAFVDQASPERIRQARELYARYRTDDLLKRLSGAAPGNSGEAELPPGTGTGPADKPR